MSASEKRIRSSHGRHASQSQSAGNTKAVRALTSLFSTSQTIRKRTISDHANDLDKAVNATVWMYAWVGVLQKRYDCSILLKEALLDLIGSISSAMSGFYRQGMFSLRSCLEMTLEFVYFVDHPIEFRRWRSSETEPKLGKWLDEGLLGREYMEIFVPKRAIKAGLTNYARPLYGKLSEFIHAQKVDTMQITKHSMKVCYDNGRFNRWQDYYMRVVSACNLALCVRFWKDAHSSKRLKSIVPQVKKNPVIRL